jgi:hypothetical protein
MKKMMFKIFAIVLGLTIYACSDSGNDVQNPNDAAEEFANPTGTLTSGNAKDVANAGVDAKNANGASSSASYLSKGSSNKIDNKYFPANKIVTQDDIENCVTTSGNSSTIDWGCLAPALGETENQCTGDGTTTTTTNDAENFYTTEFNGFSVNCSGDDAFDFSCDGTSSYSTTSSVYCSNMTCTFADFETTWNGCVDGTALLINVDDDSFVLENIEANIECTTVNMTIRHSGGTDTVTCNVSSHIAGCSNLDGVTTVSSCTIDTAE